MTAVARRRRLLKALLSGSRLRSSILEELRASLQVELFGAVPPYPDSPVVSPSDPRLEVLLDVTEALKVRDLDRPSYFWHRAPILKAAGRYVEAAADYLEAAVRFDRLAITEPFTGDEADWAKDARYLACRSYIMGGFYLTAWRLMGTMTRKDRDEMKDLLRQRLSRPRE